MKFPKSPVGIYHFSVAGFLVSLILLLVTAPILPHFRYSDLVESFLFTFVLVSASVQACLIHLAQLMADRGATPKIAAFAVSKVRGAGLASRARHSPASGRRSTSSSRPTKSRSRPARSGVMSW